MRRKIIKLNKDEMPYEVNPAAAYNSIIVAFWEKNEKLRLQGKEEMEKRLYDAAFEGDAAILGQLIQEDPLLLDKATLNCQDKTPLHIASMFGHVEFVKGILRVNSDMCLVPDRFGRNPLHLAVIKGRLPILQVLIQAKPLAAREKVDGGGSVLHLCVKYNQLTALDFLLQTIKDHEFANMKDCDGMTVLHLAICDKQNETIKYLLRSNIVDVNARNANGNTALDLFDGQTNSEIAKLLEDAGAKRAKDIAIPGAENGPEEAKSNSTPSQGGDWLAKKRDTLMVVASLIATMAFQVGVNPAGGVWQDDSKPDDLTAHMAGEAVMAHKHPRYYRNFVRTNTIAFVSSLSTILFLISGLPFRHKFFMWALMVIMWLTISAIALTYGISIVIVTPKDNKKQLSHVIETAVTVWCGVMTLLLLGNTARLINRWLKRRGIDLWKTIRHGNRAVQAESNV